MAYLRNDVHYALVDIADEGTLIHYQIYMDSFTKKFLWFNDFLFAILIENKENFYSVIPQHAVAEV